MPAARTYGKARGAASLHDAYLDRLLTWSDIQEYMPFLHDTAKSYDKVRVLELGTRAGNSTMAFLAAAEAAGGHVWSGDVTDVRNYPEISPLTRVPFWTFVHGSDLDPAVQAQFPAEVDVFFLDTSHEYEHTLAELRAYMPRVAPGGVALFHDTNLCGWADGLPAGLWVEAPRRGRAIPRCGRPWMSTARRRGCPGRTSRGRTAWV